VTEHDLKGWHINDVSGGEWRTDQDGSPFKFIGAADGLVFVLSKLAAGTRGERHVHEGPEFLYVLEGDLQVNGVEMKPGCGYAAATGTTHSEFASREGATFVVVLKPG
jgi:anti-sigma factor ChrR (cupin superfamily)